MSFAILKTGATFALRFARISIKTEVNVIRALSSVGSEHLVYTEGVGGSNPSAPTSNRKPHR